MLYVVDFEGIQTFSAKEIALLRVINHFNIIRLHDVLQMSTATFVFTELCRGGHLLDYIQQYDSKFKAGSGGGIPETECRRFFRELYKCCPLPPY